jgi:hypothetical protein
VFTHAPDAVEAALAIQRQLRSALKHVDKAGRQSPPCFSAKRILTSPPSPTIPHGAPLYRTADQRVKEIAPLFSMTTRT